MCQQECIPVGCILSAAVAVSWEGRLAMGVSAQGGCLPREGACPSGGVCPGRVSAQRGMYVPRGGCLPRGVCTCPGEGVCPGGVYLDDLCVQGCLSRGVPARHLL